MDRPFSLPEEEPDLSKDRPRIIALAVFLAAIIFGVDLVMPLGVAEAVPYVAVVLVILRSPDPRDPLYAAIGCSALTFFGFLLSPQGSELWLAEINRVMALFAIWVTAILARQIKSADADIRGKSQMLAGILRNMPTVAFHLGEDGYLKESVGKGLNRIGISGLGSYGRNALEPPVEMREKILSSETRDPIFYESSGMYRGQPWWFMNCLIPEEAHGKNLLGFALDITHLKQTERRLATHHAVTSILVQVESITDAHKQILQAICQSLNWNIGAIWEIDHQAQVLHCVDIWQHPSLNLDTFVSQTRGLTFARGVGFPGRVWKQGEPAWIEDVAKDTNFPRASAADQEGLHGGFAFPIQAGDHVLSVMEFFSQEVMAPDTELLNMFSAFGRQLGQFVERKHKERRLAVYNAVASVLVESETLEKTYGQILQSICWELHWKVGLLWQVNPMTNALECIETWHAPSHYFEGVIDASRRLKLALGEGLAGQVWKKGEPLGIIDIAQKPNHPLAAAAKREGLQGALAFPILLGGQVRSVMEFFSSDHVEPDEELLNMFTAIGIQIGHFIGHRETEETLRATEERERLVLNSTTEAIFGLDQDGNFTLCNAACLRLLGYKDSSFLLGKNAHDILHPTEPNGQPNSFETCTFCQSTLRGEHRHSTEEIFVDANKKFFPVECWSHPIVKDGIVIGAVVTMRKLTEDTNQVGT
ncbi:MAG: GAF domain-containing protein [Nitrospirales bacterium]|nr:GAF domain-containing protein [Nitrospira sp.]MDR4500647.1 GAF domain-containing protein [Nitrospirales bacterium]